MTNHKTSTATVISSEEIRRVAEALAEEGWATGGDFEEEFLPDVHSAISAALAEQTSAELLRSGVEYSGLGARLRVAAKALFRERKTYGEDLETVAGAISALEKLAEENCKGAAPVMLPWDVSNKLKSHADFMGSLGGAGELMDSVELSICAEAIDAFEKLAEQDRKDAARYRFARDHGKAFENYYGCDYHDIDQTLDQTIDRAQSVGHTGVEDEP